MIIMIHQKLSGVVTQIRTLFSGSTSFLDAMTKVVDFDSIVKPLNAIYDELQQNQLTVSSITGKMSMEQINQAKIGLQALAVAISSMPFNMGGISCSN